MDSNDFRARSSIMTAASSEYYTSCLVPAVPRLLSVLLSSSLICRNEDRGSRGNYNIPPGHVRFVVCVDCVGKASAEGEGGDS